MDSTDEKIIRELKENARASFTEIAREVGVSEGTVRNRVEKMRESGVIEKFTVKLSDTGNVQVFASVEVSTERGFDQLVEEFPEDVEIYELAGDIDVLVKISRNSSEEVNEVVDAIRAVEGVEDTRTYMVLSDRS